MPKQGEIILIPVPFTDLSSQKRRPVIVISSTDYNRHSRDMLIVAMTSNPTQVPFSFSLGNDDLEHGILNRPSTVRADKIYTLEQTLIVKRFGLVKQNVVEHIFDMIREILSGSK